MKKLTKLNINPEKVMKNEELVALRGGYGGGGSSWYCKYHAGETVIILGCVTSDHDCNSDHAWDSCKLNYPTFNEMAGGCSGSSSECTSF